MNLQFIEAQLTDAEITALVNSWVTAGVITQARATALLVPVVPVVFTPPPSPPMQTLPPPKPITAA